jgi:arylsulfatase
LESNREQCAGSAAPPFADAVAKFLLDLGYTTGEFGKNHLGDHVQALPTAHGFQEFWGYLYHLDAMQGVSFPDINKTPTQQGIVRRARTRPSPDWPKFPELWILERRFA